jgi:hypothetical protein
MNLDLSGQQTIYNAVAPRIVQLKDAMNLRKPIFKKLPYAKKVTWVQSPRDPVMGLAWDVYKYLYNFFGGIDPNDLP